MTNNGLKTSLLMAAIMALFGVVGMLIGGAGGLLVALILGGGVNFWAYWHSDQMVLRMYQAREVDPQTEPAFYRLVADLAARASLPMPRVYLINEAQPNAFATGRDPEHAAVAATTGILELLSERELRGVMAHELAHVQNRDTLISTITASVAGAISALANFSFFFSAGHRNGERQVHPAMGLLVSILAPIGASLIQLAISRSREFEADRVGAAISEDPIALANALMKIEHYVTGRPLAAAEAHPETAQMMIINPLSGEGISGLFRTHPLTEERVSRLKALHTASVLPYAKR